MTKLNDLVDLKTITSNITSFSHAYLFVSNSLDLSYPFVKEFAKEIILGKNYDINDENIDVVSHQIDCDEYDDLYIVNPTTIGINTEEINKLMSYMETKSLRPNGKRVYIIYGFERLSRDVSNKILKFLEEPLDNVYALLMTENIEKILPTIISRCQIINFMIPCETISDEKIALAMAFFNKLFHEGKKTIAYEYQILGEIISNRVELFNMFEVFEKIISESINKKMNYVVNDKYINDSLLNYSTKSLVSILNITNKLKCLIKRNINLNLLLDRYIIELIEELDLCKK